MTAPALQESPVPIAAMTAHDIDAVTEIERLCFRTPWTASVFREELDRPQARIDVVHDAADGRAVAFINYWLVVDEVHLLNVATHPQVRRQGLARALVGHAIAVGQAAGCRLVTLEVRRSNLHAQDLYAGFGFRSVAVRPGYYADDQEDAIVMLLDI